MHWRFGQGTIPWSHILVNDGPTNDTVRGRVAGLLACSVCAGLPGRMPSTMAAAAVPTNFRQAPRPAPGRLRRGPGLRARSGMWWVPPFRRAIPTHDGVSRSGVGSGRLACVYGDGPLQRWEYCPLPSGRRTARGKRRCAGEKSRARQGRSRVGARSPEGCRTAAAYRDAGSSTSSRVSVTDGQAGSTQDGVGDE
jgi:hypothetical protein